MPVEIERKFLVTGDDWRNAGQGTRYRQGYLSTDPARSVRIRVAGEQAWLTIKGISRGASRDEYEYPIPADEAVDMLDTLCLPGIIDKTRYRVEHDGLTWEVDEFSGENDGLVIAEVELQHEDQALTLPHWAGREVTGDTRYYNASLVEQPYRAWRDHDND